MRQRVPERVVAPSVAPANAIPVAHRAACAWVHIWRSLAVIAAGWRWHHTGVFLVTGGLGAGDRNLRMEIEHTPPYSSAS
eukprot:7491475-Pyramimonas_sp.AAC.1